MDIGKIVGGNLSRLRTERRLSLGQLADRCHLSKMMLSRIEKGDANPTVNTLWKIANGLGIPYAALLEQQSAEPVIRGADLPVQADEAGHYRISCYYESAPGRSFELFCMELDARCRYVSIGHVRETREYLLVLSGELTLTAEGRTSVLGPGDAVRFDASGEHTYLAGEEMLRAVVLNDAPA
jgi:transcriptional regulator with XRE-family HTH domain